MDNQANLKSVNSVKEVPSSKAGHVSLVPNHLRRCWTWMSPGDRRRNQIDFTIAPKRFRNAILSYKSMLGADYGSDHVPVVCVVRMKVKKLKKPKQSPKFQYDALKKDAELKWKFNVTI
ncbi:craniofacial development protein 2-like [Elysia marginata]|uniref:Craniofacial development protein 2-like n=1 Tax=Elysia marginata TaxID=1093978 RepID=A0AAV4J1X8_9GAST|nr:craniofacial development protein 2-like [Elysia marginata]